MSTLRRMFRYASAEGNRPLENFTTEALALAIKSDRGPIVEVLARHGLVPKGLVNRVTPRTQVKVVLGRTGYVDLLLQVRLEGAAAVEVWFENKAHAPEGPGQLSFYRSVIDASAGDGITRHLVAVAPDPISTADHHTYIAWQEVAEAATTSTSVVWAELVEFLKEHHMTADATLPITESEASSLGDAHRLLRKMGYLMRRVNERARAATPEWPPDRWVMDGRVKAGLLSDFARSGRLRLREGEGYAATIVWGAEPRPDGARFVVLVEADPKRTAVRLRLAAAVEAMPTGWNRPDETNRSRMLVKEAPAVAFGTEHAAVEWFLASLGELKDAGILALIPTLGAGPVATEGEGSENDGDEDMVGSFVTPQTQPGLDRVTSAD